MALGVRDVTVRARCRFLQSVTIYLVESDWALNIVCHSKSVSSRDLNTDTIGFWFSEIDSKSNRGKITQRKTKETKTDWDFNNNNIQVKISPCWLAESMSINPKQCKNLNFLSAEKTKLVQKLEIKLIDRKVAKEKLTDGQSNLLFSNQAHTLDGAIFPDCVIRLRSLSSTISKFFQRPQILLVFEKMYSCLFIPNCTRNHLITYTNHELFVTFLAPSRSKGGSQT